MGTLIMDRLLPEDSVIGSRSAGVIGYFSRFPVVNLDGLVNSHDYMRALAKGTRATSWRKYGITRYANVDSTKGGWRSLLFDKRRTLLFEGPPYRDPSGERGFKLWSYRPAAVGVAERIRSFREVLGENDAAFRLRVGFNCGHRRRQHGADVCQGL